MTSNPGEQRLAELEQENHRLRELIELQDAYIHILILGRQTHDDVTLEAWRCTDHHLIEVNGAKHIAMIVEDLTGQRLIKNWMVRGDGGVGTTWIATTERCA